jgi:type I restriction enzyme S subunit
VSDKNGRSLKLGWRRVKFGDVVRLSKTRSQDPLADGFERYVGLEHLEPGDLRIRTWGNVADGVTFTTVFQPGQVLFGKRRAYQRKVAVADFAGVCSGDIYVLETKSSQNLLPALLPFICQTDSFFAHAVGTSAGSLSPRTNWTSLADFDFPLPPVEEQMRLVDILAAAVEAIEALETARNDTRTLLRSLSMDQFCRDGESRQPLARHYSVVSGQVDPKNSNYSDLPLIAPNHIEPGTARIITIESASQQAAISGKYLFEPGAVIYSKIRPNLVKAAIAPCRALCSADMYALITKESLRNEFLLEILLSNHFTKFAVSGSMRTGIPKLNREHLAHYKCDVPDLEKQDEYLARVRALREAESSLNQRRNTTHKLKNQIIAGEMGV